MGKHKRVFVLAAVIGLASVIEACGDDGGGGGAGGSAGAGGATGGSGGSTGGSSAGGSGGTSGSGGATGGTGGATGGTGGATGGTGGATGGAGGATGGAGGASGGTGGLDGGGGSDGGPSEVTSFPSGEQPGTQILVVGSTLVITTQQGSLGPYTVRTVPKSGGASTPLIPSKNCGSIATDGTKVYAICAGVGYDIVSVPVTGGTPTVLYTSTTKLIFGLATDGAAVYFSSQVGSSTVELLKVPTGGSAVSLGTSPTTMGPVIGPAPAAVDSSAYFLVTPYYFLSAPIAGGSVNQISASVGLDNRGFAMDTTHLYATGNSSVRRVLKTGGTLETGPITGGGFGVVVDGGYVYYGFTTDFNNGNPELRRAPVGTATGTKLASLGTKGQVGPIAIDATTVWVMFFDSMTGTTKLLSVPKP